MVRPLQSFFHTQAAGGIAILAGAIVALLWANFFGAEAYNDFWHTQFLIQFGAWSLELDFKHLINEGLMTIFFLVVGLEIKRELATGELRDPRNAALPVLGAIGGMVVPALIYLAINGGTGVGARGWGIPMATDIAFAVGVISLAGKGLPSGLKLFLLSLAIVDDLGAILVIAVFYSTDLALSPLGLAATLVIAIVVMQRLQVRSMIPYIIIGTALWLAVQSSGVHASIVGALIGLLTPSTPFQRSSAVANEARRVADLTAGDPERLDSSVGHWARLWTLSKESVSPLSRLEFHLHPWSSFVIVPLFALANAGVEISPASLAEAASSPIALGVAAGLVVGKTTGIWLAAWIGLKLKVARLPTGVNLSNMFAVAATAGVGFTVSLFVGELAFTDRTHIEIARIGTLGGSLIAGVIGAFLLKRARRSPTAPPPTR
ncbi:MAG: Na+/H+ antiporter NhaA [Actinomycetota bacterium]